MNPNPITSRPVELPPLPVDIPKEVAWALDAADATGVTLNPRNDHELLKEHRYQYPVLGDFTVRDLRRYLEKELNLGETACWLFGSSTRPYRRVNDVDLCLHANVGDDRVLEAVYSFLIPQIKRARKYDRDKAPLRPNLVFAAYLSDCISLPGRQLLGLQTLDVNIRSGPSRSSVSCADGRMFCFKTRKMICSMGPHMATTQNEIDQVAHCIAHRLFPIKNREECGRLLFRLVLEIGNGYEIAEEDLAFAIEQFLKEYDYEKIPGSHKRSFSSDFPKALRKHHPGPEEKLVAVINWLFVLRRHPKACGWIAEVMIREAKEFDLEKFVPFFEGIKKAPDVFQEQHLFISGIMLCRWMQSDSEKSSPLNLYSFPFNEPSDGGLKPRYRANVKAVGAENYLALPSAKGSPVELALDFLELARKRGNADGAGIAVLQPLFQTLGLFNTENFRDYFGPHFLDHIALDLVRGLGKKHVQDVLAMPFKQHVQPIELFTMLVRDAPSPFSSDFADACTDAFEQVLSRQGKLKDRAWAVRVEQMLSTLMRQCADKPKRELQRKLGTLLGMCIDGGASFDETTFRLWLNRVVFKLLSAYPKPSDTADDLVDYRNLGRHLLAELRRVYNTKDGDRLVLLKLLRRAARALGKMEEQPWVEATFRGLLDEIMTRSRPLLDKKKQLPEFNAVQEQLQKDKITSKNLLEAFLNASRSVVGDLDGEMDFVLLKEQLQALCLEDKKSDDRSADVTKVAKRRIPNLRGTDRTNNCSEVLEVLAILNDAEGPLPHRNFISLSFGYIKRSLRRNILSDDLTRGTIGLGLHNCLVKHLKGTKKERGPAEALAYDLMGGGHEADLTKSLFSRKQVQEIYTTILRRLLEPGAFGTEGEIQKLLLYLKDYLEPDYVPLMLLGIRHLVGGRRAIRESYQIWTLIHQLNRQTQSWGSRELFVCTAELNRALLETNSVVDALRVCSTALNYGDEVGDINDKTSLLDYTLTHVTQNGVLEPIHLRSFLREFLQSSYVKQISCEAFFAIVRRCRIFDIDVWSLLQDYAKGTSGETPELLLIKYFVNEWEHRSEATVARTFDLFDREWQRAAGILRKTEHYPLAIHCKLLLFSQSLVVDRLIEAYDTFLHHFRDRRELALMLLQATEQYPMSHLGDDRLRTKLEDLITWVERSLLSKSSSEAHYRELLSAVLRVCGRWQWTQEGSTLVSRLLWSWIKNPRGPWGATGEKMLVPALMATCQHLNDDGVAEYSVQSLLALYEKAGKAFKASVVKSMKSELMRIMHREGDQFCQRDLDAHTARRLTIRYQQLFPLYELLEPARARPDLWNIVATVLDGVPQALGDVDLMVSAAMARNLTTAPVGKTCEFSQASKLQRKLAKERAKLFWPMVFGKILRTSATFPIDNAVVVFLKRVEHFCGVISEDRHYSLLKDYLDAGIALNLGATFGSNVDCRPDHYAGYIAILLMQNLTANEIRLADIFLEHLYNLFNSLAASLLFQDLLSKHHAAEKTDLQWYLDFFNKWDEASHGQFCKYFGGHCTGALKLLLDFPFWSSAAPMRSAMEFSRRRGVDFFNDETGVRRDRAYTALTATLAQYFVASGQYCKKRVSLEDVEFRRRLEIYVTTIRLTEHLDPAAFFSEKNRTGYNTMRELYDAKFEPHLSAKLKPSSPATKPRGRR